MAVFGEGGPEAPVDAVADGGEVGWGDGAEDEFGGGAAGVLVEVGLEEGLPGGGGGGGGVGHGGGRAEGAGEVEEPVGGAKGWGGQCVRVGLGEQGENVLIR